MRIMTLRRRRRTAAAAVAAAAIERGRGDGGMIIAFPIMQSYI